MSRHKDSIDVLVVEEGTNSFTALSQEPVSNGGHAASAPTGAVTARFHGYDLCNQPLISGVPGLPGEVVTARTTVPLLSEQIGSTLVVLFEQGDVRRPIVVGALQDQRPSIEQLSVSGKVVSVQADESRLVLLAEREIVLRCGEASITLTRAGKVLIRGEYVSVWSSGINRIKGGSVQIN